MMDRDEILEALEEVAEYGVPGHGAARLIDVGSEPYLDFFRREVIEGLVEQGGATCRFFEGAYGAGKSHLLSLLTEMALERGMCVVKTDLSQALHLEDWRLITTHILQNLECRIGGEVRRSLPNVLEALGEFGEPRTAKLADAALPHAGFKNAMRAALDLNELEEEPSLLLRLFLRGRRVRVSDLRQAGLRGIRDPLTAKNAEDVLQTVLGALFVLTGTGTVLLFDENERTFVFRGSVPPKRVTRGANLMRRLIDGCFTGNLRGTVAVFAVLPSFMEASALAYPALGQRIEVPGGWAQVGAWRWPSATVEAVCGVDNEEDFLTAAANRIADLAAQLSAHTDGLKQRLLTEGGDVLQHNVGSGYRRPLMKRLATIALQSIDEAGIQ